MLEQPTLNHSLEIPDDKLKRLCEQVAEQTVLLEPLRERIRELEARWAKNNHNSSRPPSSDSPFKTPPPRAQRQPSGLRVDNRADAVSLAPGSITPTSA